MWFICIGGRSYYLKGEEERERGGGRERLTFITELGEGRRSTVTGSTRYSGPGAGHRAESDLLGPDLIPPMIRTFNTSEDEGRNNQHESMKLREAKVTTRKRCYSRTYARWGARTWCERLRA